MERIFCDKCGKLLNKPMYTFNIKNYKGIYLKETSELQLCKECYKDVHKELSKIFKFERF